MDLLSIKYVQEANTLYCVMKAMHPFFSNGLILINVLFREGNSPDHHQTITYNQLLRSVCRCANALKLLGKTSSSSAFDFAQLFFNANAILVRSAWTSDASIFTNAFRFTLMCISVIQVWRKETESLSTYPWFQSWCTRCWRVQESGLFTR